MDECPFLLSFPGLLVGRMEAALEKPFEMGFDVVGDEVDEIALSVTGVIGNVVGMKHGRGVLTYCFEYSSLSLRFISRTDIFMTLSLRGMLGDWIGV